MYKVVSFNNGRDVTGGLTAALGGVWDITGDGVANQLNPGSDYNFAVGTITAFDLAQGAINHAVRVAIGRDALKSPGLKWTDNIPWPNARIMMVRILQRSIGVAGLHLLAFHCRSSTLSLKFNLCRIKAGLMLAEALKNYQSDLAQSHLCVAMAKSVCLSIRPLAWCVSALISPISSRSITRPNSVLTSPPSSSLALIRIMRCRSE